MSKSGSWDDMKRAKEEEYFQRQDAEAVKRLQNEANRKRLSPITGKPMEQITLMGVVVDRCPTSGGIWLDAGELEQIVKSSKSPEAQGSGFLSNFLESLFVKK